MIEEGKPSQENEEQTGAFYLLFNELANVEDIAMIPDLEEIEEIERLSRMVADVAQDPPRFITST